MGWRYCPECEQWYLTRDYTVDESGETICKKDDHGAVHGFLLDTPVRRKAFFNQHPEWYDDRDQMYEAAKNQGLIADA